jgi:hypothetical protein
MYSICSEKHGMIALDIWPGREMGEDIRPVGWATAFGTNVPVHFPTQMNIRSIVATFSELTG